MAKKGRTEPAQLDVVALLNKAALFADAGRTVELMALYRDWLGPNGKHPLAYAVLFNLGCALMNAADDEAAAQAFSEAARRKPDFWSAIFNLGLVLQRLGQDEQALAAWMRLTALPDDAQGEERAMLLRGLNNCGAVLEALQRHAEAESMLARSLRLMPEQPGLLARVQVLLNRQGAFAAPPAVPSPGREAVADRPPCGIHVYQICYSEQTRRENDTGFLVLDNMANPRPDWREYWPMRKFLLHNCLNDDDYYGFFSPKFRLKTSLDSAAVHAFVRAHAPEADVFLFSPFFDLCAYARNIFEQGSAGHPDVAKATLGSLGLVAPGVDLQTLLMSSKHVVFCNYIVAKPAFWKVWLEHCEPIFALAEENASELATRLNADTTHDGAGAPVKVFVIERMASLLLGTQSHWKVKAYDSTTLPFSSAPIGKYPRELILLDALKIAASRQQRPEYFSCFLELRHRLSEGGLVFDEGRRA